MKRQLLLKMLLLVLGFITALQAAAYQFVQNGIYYDISGTNAYVTYKDTNYNSYSGTVNIPATVTYNGTTYNVVQINPSAFKNCTGLIRVVLPNSIKYLMNNAFEGCTGLTNITLPAGFYSCYNKAFAGCTNLKTIVCLMTSPATSNTNNFPTEVYSSATLYVPQGKVSTYQGTACWSSFSNIKEIECDFVEDAIFYNDLGDNKAQVTYVNSNYDFYSNFYSGDVAIPSTVTHGGNTYTVTSIHNKTFYYCHNLYNVSIPATVSDIGNYAFYDCTHLTSIIIPEGVEDINYCTFGSCSALQNVIIPSSVTWIAQNVFVNCDALTSITCKADTPPMCTDSSCFPSSAYSNATLNVPSTSLSQYQQADVWRNFSNIVGQDYDFEANGIYYIITGPNTASVTYKDTNFNSYSGTVNIPATVTHDGTLYTVTAIGMSAFRQSSSLTSVSIPNTVTSIDYAAFYRCSALTSITVPSNVVTIGDHAFRETGLTQVTLRNGVNTIGRAAFYGCEALTGVSIPNSVTSLGDACFQNCSSLTSASIGTGITDIPVQCFAVCTSLSSINIPSTVKSYGSFAFCYTRFTTLYLTEGVETIGYGVFAGCQQLTSINFPASVTHIDDNVLSDCYALANITVDSANPNYCATYNELYDKAKTRLLRYAPQKPNAFAATPNTCVTIAPGAYDSATNLDYIIIGSNIEYIGYNAFDDCSSLNNFYIADGNTHYMTDDGILYSMTSDGKPQSIIKYPANRPEKHYSVLNMTDTVQACAFSQTSHLQSVYIPQQLKEVESSAFTSSSVKRVVIDEGLTRIQDYAFDSCDSLQSVYLPSTVTSIGEQAFVYAWNLSEITFASSTPPSVDPNAFYGAGYSIDHPVTIYVPAGASSAYSSIDWDSNYFEFEVNDAAQLEIGTTFTVDSLKYQTTDATLNAMVTGVTSNAIVDPGIPPEVAYQGNLCTVNMLKDHAFANIYKMVRADVPFTVQQIDDYCFYNCRNLKKLMLREGVKQIDAYAFSHINELVSVTIPASADSITGDAFTYDPNLIAIYVEDDNNKYTCVDGILFSKDKKRLIAFADGRTTTYEVPDGTQVIAREAFRGASALDIIHMPNSLREIERYAFFDCSTLPGIEVPKGVTTIGNYAFGSCTSMTYATLPSTLTELGYNAFYNVPDLAYLYVKATTPPTCLTYANPRTGEFYEPFIDDHYSNVNLQVPMGSAQAYRTANVWKKFTNINENNFPAEFIRGDVNGDGHVNIADVTSLIDYLLGSNTGADINAADVNEDGNVNIADVTSLIDYLLSGAWPEPAPIDMWYLWGNFIGSQPWGDIYDNHLIGISALPLYPVGSFDSQGKGTLTWTGFVPYGYFSVVHKLTGYDDVVSEMWVVDNNTGEYCVQNMINDNPNYSNFLLDPGCYTITLDTKTMALSITPYNPEVISFGSITMPGQYNGWINTANAMNAVNTTLGLDNHDWWVDDWTMTNSSNSIDYELKFCAYDDWTYNWGATDFPYGTGVTGGMNIPAKPGTYTVFFNDITGQYNFIKK